MGKLENLLVPHEIRAAEGIPPRTMTTDDTTIYNVTGTNSRINVNSVDRSTNVADVSVGELFASMRRALEEAALEPESSGALQTSIDQMEAAIPQDAFAQESPISCSLQRTTSRYFSRSFLSSHNCWWDDTWSESPVCREIPSPGPPSNAGLSP